MIRTILAGAVLASAVGVACAQETAPTFEVASVRRDTAGGSKSAAVTADGFRMTNLPVLVPILKAYIPTTGGETAYFANDRIMGGPDWMRMDGYDIEAKVAAAELAEWHKPAAQNAMLRAKLQTLLVERCKLVVHREMKELPIYSLVAGKSGVKFTESKPGDKRPAGVSLPGDAVLVPSNGGQTLSFYGASMASVAQVLTNFAGRPVEDRTGLAGKYDLVLQRGAPGDDAALSIFTAVEDLGLRLEPAKAQVETLVIDHLERPSEN
jgi:uncharacterized protein (TIGR03435 family)